MHLFFIILAAVLALYAWVWRALSRRVISGTLTRSRAIGRYIVWALVPLFLLAAVFFGAVGLEEWLGVPVIGEAVARSALPAALLLLGAAAIGSACFGLRCTWLGGGT